MGVNKSVIQVAAMAARFRAFRRLHLGSSVDATCLSDLTLFWLLISLKASFVAHLGFGSVSDRRRHAPVRLLRKMRDFRASSG